MAHEHGDPALIAIALVEASFDHDLARVKALVDEGQNATEILNYLILFVDRLARAASPQNPRLITERLRAAFLEAEAGQ